MSGFFYKKTIFEDTGLNLKRIFPTNHLSAPRARFAKQDGPKIKKRAGLMFFLNLQNEPWVQDLKIIDGNMLLSVTIVRCPQ